MLRSAVVAGCVATASAYVASPVVLSKSQVCFAGTCLLEVKWYMRKCSIVVEAG